MSFGENIFDIMFFSIHSRCSNGKLYLMFSGDHNSDLNGAESLVESNGEEDVSRSENDMMPAFADEALNYFSEGVGERVLKRSSRNPTSPKLSSDRSEMLTRISLPNQPTTSNQSPDPIQRPSPSKSSSDSNRVNPSRSSNISRDINESSECLANDFEPKNFHCKIRKCSVVKSSEKEMFEHVRIDHSDRKYQCDMCPIAFKVRVRNRPNKEILLSDWPITSHMI